ncbi:hypothetical protein [Xenorhabdus siamensis]|uniref:hypothetical protein n=1 Tax=Xenorhabdus siamensis TaxID=3136254 RepID=UPI0030F46916
MRKSQVRDGYAAAKEPWLIFSSTNEFKPRQIMKLYSRRMQIGQNFRNEKSERFGFGPVTATQPDVYLFCVC